MGRYIHGDIEGKVWNDAFAVFNHFQIEPEGNRYFTECGNQCSDSDVCEGDPCPDCTDCEGEDSECVLGDCEELLYFVSSSDIDVIQETLVKLRQSIIEKWGTDAEEAILAIEAETDFNDPSWITDANYNRVATNRKYWYCLDWEGFILGTLIVRCFKQTNRCYFCVDLH